MKKLAVLSVALLASMGLAIPAVAQSTAATPQAIPPSMNPQTNTAAAQVSIFGNYSDQAKRLSKDDKAKGKTIDDLLAQDKAEATALLQSIHHTCVVTNAVLAAAGPGKDENGANVDTKTFEMSCGDGGGYFIVSPTPGQPFGYTCFGADATRLADLAAGRKPSAVCGLPANSDVKHMASAVLTAARKTCAVRDVRWIGQSAKSHTDYTEVACAEGGYIVAAPLPGSTMKTIVVTCRDSYLQGIPCKMSDNGPPIVTMRTFLDVIAANRVACKITGSRLVGKESIKQRHIVELQCTDHPQGIVTYIPLEGNKNPFESVDCRTAAQRGVVCTLSKTN